MPICVIQYGIEGYKLTTVAISSQSLTAFVLNGAKLPASPISNHKPFMTLCAFFVCKIRLKNHTSYSFSHRNPCGAYVVFQRQQLFHRSQMVSLWSSSLSLVLKIITKLAQLKHCNHEARLFWAMTHSQINSLKALKHRMRGKEEILVTF